MLAAALAWAARGFPVFPLAEGTKDVPIVDDFYDVATVDPAVITRWWRDALTGAERAYNVGVSTTGRRVIDIDVKSGRHGVSNYLQLGGHFDTLVVKTPSGGLHCYFAGEDVAGRVGILGKDSGLDIRSYHNYVLAPGSVLENGCYSLEVDHQPVELPAEFTPHLRPPLARSDGAAIELPETPAMLARAVAFLQSRAPAVEGQGGDDHTYQTAARLRDLGISEATAALLLAEHFNPRCVPPWQDDDLKAKVANAYGYGTAPFGVLSPETHYGDLKIPEGDHLVSSDSTETGPLSSTFAFGNALDPFNLAPRPWLYNRILLRRTVTALVGAGSAGKSVLTLEIAAHLAMGKAFHGYGLKDGLAQRSIIYNAEDDLEELTRRLWAICSHFRFDWPTVRDSIALVSRRQLRLMLTEGDPPRLNNEHVVPLVKAATSAGVGFIGLDPLVTLHQAKEEDNVAMRYVMETCSLIAEQTNTAVCVVHHIGKPGTNSKMGEMYAARGGGEIVNTARVGLNLTSPSAQEAPLFGIEPKERHAYVALSDAKMNMSLAAGDARWFKKKGVRLPNGDEVGVLDPYDMAAQFTTQTNVHATAIAASLKGRGVATCTLSEAAAILKASDLLLTKLSMGELRAKVMTALASPVETADGIVCVRQDLVGGRFDQKVVLE